ncbi:hypothetical protein A2715_02890 [Candidatus Woesebacteria bacterium RIFCSPHIGHO2_01_FULL_39_32]|uniref:Uncharacterized protein n=1 Tax=Candidatus Woesebacteria bacterium RIFCSPLOWO2_01_FULL_39_25 TaxID=1802521 RepID=A0A1F8BK41_9BACT|nr:MAG: hypothetical protein A2715_02890 [Candidatus Woesebacteria bacterium RIFCSPHIGHO2_01_FULL_39_32]OGM37923.1 MAG: hypothetical protein A3F01_02870 [Candidatus Woesebacteria bacterium RIFCSPHIGHO2_12_FULL_38_11]OGM64441.1 MAG: hypothetical protein A2893_01065 [Candidatus Woesebacteria bacterium RIFCSPLOWO2_01_FULL_39_25]
MSLTQERDKNIVEVGLGNNPSRLRLSSVGVESEPVNPLEHYLSLIGQSFTAAESDNRVLELLDQDPNIVSISISQTDREKGRGISPRPRIEEIEFRFDRNQRFQLPPSIAFTTIIGESLFYSSLSEVGDYGPKFVSQTASPDIITPFKEPDISLPQVVGNLVVAGSFVAGNIFTPNSSESIANRNLISAQNSPQGKETSLLTFYQENLDLLIPPSLAKPVNEVAKLSGAVYENGMGLSELAATVINSHPEWNATEKHMATFLVGSYIAVTPDDRLVAIGRNPNNEEALIIRDITNNPLLATKIVIEKTIWTIGELIKSKVNNAAGKEVLQQGKSDLPTEVLESLTTPTVANPDRNSSTTQHLTSEVAQNEINKWEGLQLDESKVGLGVNFIEVDTGNVFESTGDSSLELMLGVGVGVEPVKPLWFLVIKNTDSGNDPRAFGLDLDEDNSSVEDRHMEWDLVELDNDGPRTTQRKLILSQNGSGSSVLKLVEPTGEESFLVSPTDSEGAEGQPTAIPPDTSDSIWEQLGFYSVAEAQENPSEEAATETSEESDKNFQIIESIPNDFKFLDGRVVKAMVSGIKTDEQTDLISAVDGNGNIISYKLYSGEWATNPFLESGFNWNFYVDGNGVIYQHHIIEDKGHEPYPIQGIKYLLPDQLPDTYWDENNPTDFNPRAWPEDGTLAVLDRHGNIIMYYSKLEKYWWYAGYQQELPGNMVYRISGAALESLGFRHIPASEDKWPGVTDHWLDVRNMIDWFAYTRRTGSFISFENFMKRNGSGEIFSYKSWVYNLQTGEYELTKLSSNTRLIFTATVSGRSRYSYGIMNGGEANAVNGGGGLWTSVQLNPDNSVSIISGEPFDSMEDSEWPFGRYVDAGVTPFSSYVAGVLGASDKNQKEGIDRDFPVNRLPNDLADKWLFLIYNYLVDIRQMRPEDEYSLSQVTPIIIPDVQITK